MPGKDQTRLSQERFAGRPAATAVPQIADEALRWAKSSVWRQSRRSEPDPARHFALDETSVASWAFGFQGKRRSPHGVPFGDLDRKLQFAISILTWKAAGVARNMLRTNVTVLVTQAGTHKGRTFNTRVLADNGAGTLTIAHTVPWVGA
jgi:hypothetical protein